MYNPESNNYSNIFSLLCSSLYHLDNEAIVERILSPEKCLKYKAKKLKCKVEETAKCIRIRGLIRICDNIDHMIRGIAQGCDV